MRERDRKKGGKKVIIRYRKEKEIKRYRKIEREFYYSGCIAISAMFM